MTVDEKEITHTCIDNEEGLKLTLEIGRPWVDIILLAY
jgi:hypothetical protein